MCCCLSVAAVCFLLNFSLVFLSVRRVVVIIKGGIANRCLNALRTHHENIIRSLCVRVLERKAHMVLGLKTLSNDKMCFYALGPWH